jgi:hypothetical protein
MKKAHICLSLFAATGISTLILYFVMTVSYHVSIPMFLLIEKHQALCGFAGSILLLFFVIMMRNASRKKTKEKALNAQNGL